MSIFGIIKCEDKAFTGDKLRVDVSESFIAPNLNFATISHEISVDNGATWYDISTSKKMDWYFTTAGVKNITLRLNTTATTSQTFTQSVLIIDIVSQGLFSKDADLYQYEDEIDALLPSKWSSWNKIHLAAQEWITDWLDEKGYRDKNGNKYTKADLLDSQQVKQLSCYKALELIFENSSTIVGDIYSTKATKYQGLVSKKLTRESLKLDYNKDGIANEGETTSLGSVILRRG